MRNLVLFVIGRDRPGIVAAVTERLLAHEVNIEDSRMGILRGHFSMMLLLAAPERADTRALADELLRVAEGLGMEWVWLTEVAELPPDPPRPTHVVTVYGADHPGIVHGVSAALAAREVSIADLQTRLVGDEEEPGLYVMVLEVTAPEGLDVPGLEELLRAVGEAQGVEVSVRPLDADTL
jgi:glycine cleavage system transcriptional repressor